MRRLKLIKPVSLIIAAIFASAAALSGCSGSSSKPAAGSATELKFMFTGNKPNDFDSVLAEFEKRTKDTLNVKLNIEWSSAMSDHKDKVLLRMSSGEVYDAVFDAPFMNFRNLVTSGAYLPIESYFNNDQYPGLKAAFDPEYVKANEINGHLYGVPLTQDYGSFTLEGIMIRKDLREKYGVSKIDSIDKLQEFYDKILANEKGMIPLAVSSSRGFYHLLDSENDMYAFKKNVYLVSAGPLFKVAISPDNKKVLGIAYDGDPDEYYANFPEPYNKPDYERYIKAREWRKYLSQDSINEKDPNSLFYAGKAASTGAMAQDYVNIEKRLKANNPSAELEYFPYFKPTQKLEAGGWSTTYQAWNFLCIPKSSKKVDTTMKFLNWVFADQSNHDLFEYGIEGKHWIAVGKDKFRYPEGVDVAQNYNFFAFQLTANPKMYRLYADIPEEIQKFIEYNHADSTYVKNPLAGFVFDQNPVKVEIAKVNGVFGNITTPLAHGILEDPVASLKDANAKAREMGLDKIRDELKKQLQDFLDKTYK